MSIVRRGIKIPLLFHATIKQKYQVIHIITVLTLCLPPSTNQRFLKSVTLMFAFNYIKGLLFNNYLIYISNKLVSFCVFLLSIFSRFNLVNLYLLAYY